MILQALVQYHDRLKAEGRLPPPGYVKQEIPFLVVLNEEGRFLSLQDTRSGDGRVKRARQCIVPKGPKSTGQIAPKILWGNPAYVFARPKAGAKDPRKALKEHDAFVRHLQDLFPEGPRPRCVRTVLSFLESRKFEAVFRESEWPEIEEKGLFLTFAVESKGKLALVCEDPLVMAAVAAAEAATNEELVLGTCLVAGRSERIARLHTPIKGVRGTHTRGGDIVSFNLDAFRSHHKKQGMNAPVGVIAEAAYTSTLNALLDSRQKMTVGGSTTVFWAERPTPMEDVLADLFGLTPEVADSPRDLDAIRALLAAPRTGTPPPVNDPTPFYVLGLAPNGPRIAVRFWHVGTVAEMAEHILQYFEDMLVARPPNVPECPRLGELLRSTAVEGKPENIAPKLAGEMVAAIISGQPFPRPLLAAAIRRIKAEQAKKNPTTGKPIPNVSSTRAALIKALLVRQTRRNNSDRKEVDVSLDVTNTNEGYRLGRLFAVLERIQEQAMGRVNATIRDRYYGSASSTPVLSFPILCKLHTHHLSKLEDRKAVYLGRLVGEIVDGLSTFPPHLSLDDQGRFAIGYYHQRQAFFQKSTDTPNGGEQ